MKILITGGAGFIGSRLACMQAKAGADIVILDNLSPQIHGHDAKFSDPLTSVARCVKGDICDSGLLRSLIVDRDVIIHLAAETGTGQSMYAVERYGRVNTQGTAALLDAIVNDKSKNLQKLIVASSRAVYGEGEYFCNEHGRVFPGARLLADLEKGRFEPNCPVCGEAVDPLATTELAPFAPSSFYGLTKQMQEQMILMFAKALGLDGFALRYQNVYGPGQSLTNPYTGILAIFSNLVRQGRGLNIFEDGLESRDFVYIDDVVAATALCADSGVHGVVSMNVGSGIRTSVLDVAHAIAGHFRADVPIRVTGDFRMGDIRHNFADISRISDLTGFHPEWSFKDGLANFLAWAETRGVSDAGYDRSLRELSDRGLMRSGKSHA
jgi:dTDP-L-rhamnose 4-epimerase